MVRVHDVAATVQAAVLVGRVGFEGPVGAAHADGPRHTVSTEQSEVGT